MSRFPPALLTPASEMSLGSKAVHNMMGRNGMHGEYAMTEIRCPFDAHVATHDRG